MGDLENSNVGNSGTLLNDLYWLGARDQRLELFGQGQWADDARGSGWLALQAGDVSRPEVLAQASEDEVLGIGRAARCWAGPRLGSGRRPASGQPVLHHGHR
jgi:hypothetical protein